MTDKHLIALDLDGTLLKDNNTISPVTKKVLNKALEKGHQVMIATGRPYRSSREYYQELGLKTPIVNFNGAFIHHPLQKSWGVYHTPLDIKVAKDIVDACYTFQVNNIIAEVVDDLYFHYHDERLLKIFSLGDPKVKTGDLRQFLEDAPTSMLIHTDKTQIDLLKSHLSHAHANVIHQRSWQDPWYVIEIVKSGLNKAVGVKKVAQELDIPRKRVIAFGDEDNDLEMIEYAGTGVAMGNGIADLKSIANATTLTNEEDGIALFLNEHLNLNAL